MTSASAATLVAVVTGAGSGIGAATAVRLADEGYSLVLVGRRQERLEAVAKKVEARGRQAVVQVLDVTDVAAVKAFGLRLERCDVLVNNAGGAIGTEEVEEADPADWRVMYETNVLGSLQVTQALLPLLVSSGNGTVIVLSSTAAFTVYEGAAVTARPSTASTRWPELCAWNCAAAPYGSSKSRRGWSTPRSSASTAIAATTPDRPPCTPGSTSLWSPTTSPMSSHGQSRDPLT